MYIDMNMLSAVVFQVGTDIIYTLSFVWDFKQAMMTTAIKDGLTEVQRKCGH